MNIYIVREHNGYGEDYRVHNLKAFYTKEKAEIYLKELRKIEKERKEKYTICFNCPLWLKNFKTFEELNSCLKEYCDNFKYDIKLNQPYIDKCEFDCIECENDYSYYGHYESSLYDIEELKLEE